MFEDSIRESAHSSGVKLTDETIEKIERDMYFSKEYKALLFKIDELVLAAPSEKIRFYIKKDYDSNQLEELGYTFNPLEGGYISKDVATIILTHRDGHIRKVVQFRQEAHAKHLANMEQLKRFDVIEE